MATKPALSRLQSAAASSAAAETVRHDDLRLVPAGGSTGQYLRKSSGTDHDDAWTDPAQLLKDGRPIFSAVQAAAQSLAASTFVPITFGSEIIDSHNGHDTVTNPSRFTVPTGWAGWWRLTGLLLLGNPGARTGVCFYLGGAMIPGTYAQHAPAPSADTGINISRLVQLAVGNYVELVGFHASATAKSTIAAAPYQSSFDVVFERPA